MEGKKNNLNTIIVIIISLAILVAAAFGALYAIEMFGVDTSGATADEVQIEDTTPTEVVETTAGIEDMTTPDGTEYTLTQDWGELAKINKEIVAWVNIPNTVVNYPVLKHQGDNINSQYYLHRNYDGSYLYAGSIFIDYRSSQGAKSRNVITHGHHMNNGSMYAALLKYGKYSGNVSAYKNAPTIFFNTPEGNEQWIIFSVYKTNTLNQHGDFFNYLQGDFSSDAQFMNYVYNVKIRSLINVPVPINENDRIITLSTCSYEFKDFRTVVVARKVRPGENVSGYVNSATVNSRPVWPQVYYSNNGGTRPTVTTFKTELSKGNINWYDGSGKLSGNEMLVNTSGNRTYTVTFINYDGSIISTQSVKHGNAAKAPKNPKKPSDDYYDYVFKGWQYKFDSVTCDMTIAPKFEPVYRG